MRQCQGKTITLLNGQLGNNVDPTGDQVKTSQWEGILRPAKTLLTIVVAGATADIALWGRDNNKQLWGDIEGMAWTGVAIGTHHKIVTNLGVYSDLYARVANGGGATVTVHASPVLENNNQRGD